MLFLFGGRLAPYIRTVLGIGLLVAGVAVHAVGLEVIGAALTVWGAVTVVSRLNSR
jgi:hypothetical protein